MDDTTESTKGLDTLAFNGGLALSIDDISLGGECRSGNTTAIEGEVNALKVLPTPPLAWQSIRWSEK